MRLQFLTLALAVGATPGAHAASAYSFAKQIELVKAQTLTQGSPNLTIAVLSSGMNAQLPALANVLALNLGESGQGRETDGKDNDSDGYIDDVYGIDAMSGTTDFSDLPGLGSGTFEAAMIASPQGGIAPGAKIIPVRIVDAAGSTCEVVVANAIDYAVSRGARIIDLSFAGRMNDTEVCDAIGRAAEHEVLVVSGAGNNAEQTDGSWLPSGCGTSNLIVAAASDERSHLADFSNWQPTQVHLAAPGVAIPGLALYGGVDQRQGTTVSAAITAGVAALVWSLHPEFSVDQVKEALIRGSDTQESLTGKVLSNGRINAYKALMVKP